MGNTRCKRGVDLFFLFLLWPDDYPAILLPVLSIYIRAYDPSAFLAKKGHAFLDLGTGAYLDCGTFTNAHWSWGAAH